MSALVIGEVTAELQEKNSDHFNEIPVHKQRGNERQDLVWVLLSIYPITILSGGKDRLHNKTRTEFSFLLNPTP